MGELVDSISAFFLSKLSFFVSDISPHLKLRSRNEENYEKIFFALRVIKWTFPLPFSNRDWFLYFIKKSSYAKRSQRTQFLFIES